MIEEVFAKAAEEKMQKRAKEYERKRLQKRTQRQIYLMRHSQDYETLQLPVGASKADIKKAYRRLAREWHPDKHPDDLDTAKVSAEECACMFALPAAK